MKALLKTANGDVHTFVNRHSDMVRDIVFSNINNIITRVHASVRSLLINNFVIKKVEASSRAL